MGSKFVEKHKRKSILAALLLIFQGRAKYVAIALVLLILSVPFVVSGDILGRIIELRPVAAFLRTVGLGSVVSVINPKYSNDMLRAAMDKAADDSAQGSFWAKFLQSINATLPPGGGPSSIALLRGSKEDIFGPVELKEGKAGRRGPGQVKGAVNDEERERGETGDEVDLQGLLAGGMGGGPGGGPGDGSGLYGDLMGQNLAGSFGGGGPGSGSGPYIDRSRMGRGGSAGRASGMYASALGQAGSKVPVPNSPSKVNTKKMGRVSGFSWKNVGYKTSNAKMNLQLNSKKPMFQLAQTFAMTDAAYRSKDSAYEYQAAYVGTTYDGNDSNLDVVQTDMDPVTVPPDTSFTGAVMGDAEALNDLAKNCSNAQGTHGAAMSSDGKQMKQIGESMGKPPSCCNHGAVSKWNGKIDKVIALCNDFNGHEAQLAAACQNTSSPMNCGKYSKYKIKPCSWLKCFLAFLLMFLFAPLLLVIGLISAAFGGDFLGPFKFVFSMVTGQKPMTIDPADKADYDKIKGM
ncbi:MAG: hypothetical protein HY550_00290 [Elusimicrobia bacterium]|nr:hypothetical protein [Elusimicrobiota bacterium]